MRLIDMMTQEIHHCGGPPPEAVSISGLSLDSRRVQPGHVFAALPGSTVDGRHFIPDAAAAGAVAVLAPRDTEWPAVPETVSRLVSDRPRRGLAHMAAVFYGPQPKRIAAVTGTNGKTSVVHFLRQIWQSLGLEAASIGTLGLNAPGMARAGTLTTVDTITLHKDLARLARQGVDHCALEASSHGLDQERLDGVQIQTAAFTNLGRDHLDYHGTQEAYLAAKARLFGEVMAPDGIAVINADSLHAGALRAICVERGIQVLSYGIADDADLRILEEAPHPAGQELRVAFGGKTRQVSLPLIGGFQAQNVLCAALLALSEPGVAAPAVFGVLPYLQGVPGRLQRIGDGRQAGGVYVDYAHTPDALAAVLRAVRAHCPGRLHVVFGCGGDRDKAKRPEMGRIAAELADHVIVTDDNPRSEDPAAIRKAILSGAVQAEAVTEIGDRETAIRTAIGTLHEGDGLVIAGKGHETGQIVGATVHPFDDAAVAARILETAGAR